MSQPSLPAALFFTTSTLVAIAEMTITALYLPWPRLTITLACAAILLASCAATEWTDLHHHRHTPEPQ
ncbi:hypothetical protein AB0958_18995 [Streptomyces sp. NPDC006655]|uniref:hypothetical protein n=1 Tax=Streptomyces sp. NPDC006655 TaxID=3156898 RepID=UPI0034534738